MFSYIKSLSSVGTEPTNLCVGSHSFSLMSFSLRPLLQLHVGRAAGLLAGGEIAV
jgi:hypothetical protein